MTSKASEAIQKAMEQIKKFGTQMNPICINKTTNVSPIDKELEKEIKLIAKENGLEVFFETKSTKTTKIHGYTKVGNRPITSSFLTKTRTMIATKIM